MNVILFFSIVIPTLTKDCSEIQQDYIKIIGKNNEIIQKQISEFFNDIDNSDELSLTDSKQLLKLIHPSSLISTQTIPILTDASKLISYQVLTNSHYEWMNFFQFFWLSNSTDYIISWSSEFSQGIQNRNPTTNISVNIGTTDEMYCQSSIIINQNNQLVDCESKLDEEPKNFFILISGSNPIQTKKISNDYAFKNQSRYIKGTNKYIYRISLKQNDNPSLIEIFQYDIIRMSFEPKFKINQEFIISYLNITDYTFNLIDVKISFFDEIFILDSFGNMLIFQYNENDSSWIFKKKAQNLGQSIGFDINFKTKEIVVLQKNKVFISFNINYETVDDFSNSKVYFTKDYILIASSNKLYKLNSTLEGLYKMNGNFENILTDINQNDFFSINQNNIMHNQLQQSYILEYENSELSKGQGILKRNSCQVQIDYENIEDKSTNLIVVSKGNIITQPFYSGYYIQNLKIQHLVDGPKQSVSIQIKNDVQQNGGQFIEFDLKDDYLKVINSTNITLNDLIYIKSLSFPQSIDFDFFIFTQNKNFELIIYECTLFPDVSCFKYNELQLNVQLTQENCVLSFSQLQIQIAILVTKIQIDYYIFYSKSVFYTKTFQYSENDAVDQLYLSNVYLLLYSSYQQSIRVYFLYNLTQCLYTISSQELELLGFKNWNPKLIFTNDLDSWINIINNNQQDEIIFIRLKPNFFSIVSTMKINQSNETQILKFNQYLVLLQKLNDKYVIKIYNIQEETQIFFQKQLDFYNYEINDLASVQYSSYNGYLHIKANRQQDNKTVLLTFNIESSQHNSLRSVIEINQQNNFITSSQNFIIFVNINDISLYYFQENPYIVARTKFIDDTFITNLESSITYENGYDNVLILQNQFRLVNNYLEIINKIHYNISIDLDSNEQDNFVYDIDQDLYYGQATKFKFISSQNINTSQIINPIQLLKQDYETNIIGVADLNNDFILLLKNTSYQIMDKKTQTLAKQYQILENYICNDILLNQNETLLIQCFHDSNYYVGLIQCEGLNCQLGKSLIQIKWGLEINSIEKDQDFTFLIMKYKLMIYQIDLNEVKFIGEITYDDTQIWYASKVIKIKEKFYQLLQTNQNRELVIHDLIFDDQFKLKDKLSFNLEDIITEKYYMYREALFTQIILINIKQNGDSFTTDYIFISTSGPHFLIKLEFQILQEQTHLESKSILYALQGYANYHVLGYFYPKVTLFHDYILISYINSDRTKHLLTIYKLNDKQNQNQALNFFAALDPQHFQYYKKILTQLYFNENQLYLLTNTEHIDSQDLYQVNPYVKILFNGEIKNSYDALQVSNDYSSTRINFNINIKDHDKSSLKWLWITLVCLLGVILIFGLICYIKKRKSKTETLLG